jgi:hypothetical protein
MSNVSNLRIYPVKSHILNGTVGFWQTDSLVEMRQMQDGIVGVGDE